MIDYFPLPDGRLLHPYEIVSRLVWGPAEWLRQYQLVQERRDRVVLYAVVADPASAERLEEVERTVRPALGHGVEFVITLVDRIPVEIHRQAASQSARWCTRSTTGSASSRSVPPARRGGSSAPDPAPAHHAPTLLPPLRGLAPLAPGADRGDPGLRPLSRARAAARRGGRRGLRAPPGRSRLPRLPGGPGSGPAPGAHRGRRRQWTGRGPPARGAAAGRPRRAEPRGPRARRRRSHHRAVRRDRGRDGAGRGDGAGERGSRCGSTARPGSPGTPTRSITCGPRRSSWASRWPRARSRSWPTPGAAGAATWSRSVPRSSGSCAAPPG